MSKKELFVTVMAEVEAVLTKNKVKAAVSEELKAVLEATLAPSNYSRHEPYEENGVTYYYCRFHQQYEPEINMVLLNGKSKGYCKAGISVWNKNNARRKKAEQQAIEAMASGDFEAAKAASEEAKELKAVLNHPSSFNYEEDWNNFKGK